MKKDVLAAFMGGAIIGGITALLLAPDSGVETRRKIGEAAKRGRERVMDAMDMLREEYEIKKEEVLDAIESAKEKYKGAKEEVSQEVMDAIQCAKKEYDEVGKKLAKAMNK